MQPRLIKTSVGQYLPAKWEGHDSSGLHPLGDRVLILPDTAPEMIGGIAIPVDVTARHTLAAEAGVVVAMGEGSFTWNSDKMTPHVGRKPKLGERVAIERYSGQLFHGLDGKVYRLMESACVGAVIEEKKK